MHFHYPKIWQLVDATCIYICNKLSNNAQITSKMISLATYKLANSSLVFAKRENY